MSLVWQKYVQILGFQNSIIQIILQTTNSSVTNMQLKNYSKKQILLGGN